MRVLLLMLATTLAAGCALVELTRAGAGVRVANPEAVTSCTSLGRVTADVIAKVGFLPRHPEAVEENIEVTARNAAADMGADTIVPVSKVVDGKQTFEAYRCLKG